jgi:hypothetical protein
VEGVPSAFVVGGFHPVLYPVSVLVLVLVLVLLQLVAVVLLFALASLVMFVGIVWRLL